jgi:hypothetical protein
MRVRSAARSAGGTANKSYRRADAGLLGTRFPSLRASDSAIAMACLRLFTLPPLPPGPLRAVPRSKRRISRSTSLLALGEYFRRRLTICTSAKTVSLQKNPGQANTPVTKSFLERRRQRRPAFTSPTACSRRMSRNCTVETPARKRAAPFGRERRGEARSASQAQRSVGRHSRRARMARDLETLPGVGDLRSVDTQDREILIDVIAGKDVTAVGREDHGLG